MPHTPKHLLFPPFHDALPAPVVFRTGYMPADAAYPRHRHIWGEFVYSYSGVVQVDVGQRRYLTPSHYGLWLPPGVEHQGLNRQAACHCSLYIAAHQASALPDITCALTVGPLTRALLEHLRHHPAEAPYPDDLTRLLDVLVDQLAVAECAGSYLPTSADPQLRRALQRLEDDPTATAQRGRAGQGGARHRAYPAAPRSARPGDDAYRMAPAPQGRQGHADARIRCQGRSHRHGPWLCQRVCLYCHVPAADRTDTGRIPAWAGAIAPQHEQHSLRPGALGDNATAPGSNIVRPSAGVTKTPALLGSAGEIRTTAQGRLGELLQGINSGVRTR